MINILPLRLITKEIEVDFSPKRANDILKKQLKVEFYKPRVCREIFDNHGFHLTDRL